MNLQIFNRPTYTNRIKPFIGKQLIKVLVGQRRIGKSCVLIQIMDQIQIQDAEANLIRIDMELEEFRHLRQGQNLYEYVKSKIIKGKANYLFIDEIQEVSEFQHGVRSLLNENECDIYLTGSNAKILSGELATLLSGRYIEIDIHGLSYPEFLEFNNIIDSDESLRLYLTIGGLPYLHHLGTNQEIVFEYLKNVYSTILLKDVVARENIRNVSFLENLVAFVSDNLGSLVSAQNISKYLKSQQVNIPVPTVLSYLQALTNSYFIQKVQRAEVQGLKIFEQGEKYFFEDLGLRNCIRTFSYQREIGKLMENVIFLHLIRCQYKVFVGKLKDREIDFVAERNGQRIYVQSTYILNDEATILREFGNLLAIPDNFPKYVVSMDPIQIQGNYKGIIQIHLREFLQREVF